MLGASPSGGIAAAAFFGGYAAQIESGTQIPVQVIANNTITTQFVSASLRLIVTPQITADKTIIMEVQIEQNEPDFARAIGPGAIPPITTRRAETKLLVIGLPGCARSSIPTWYAVSCTNCSASTVAPSPNFAV